MSAPSRSRRLAFVALTAALVVGVCASLFFAFFYARAVRQPFPRSDMRIDGDRTWELDDEIGFVPVAIGRSVRRHLRTGLRYNVFTDARRLRVDAPGSAVPETVDVLAVGGSFTWGHGVEGEQAFVQVLADELGLTAANAGYPSYGTVQALQTLVRHRGLKPKVVVYAYIEDHLHRNLAPCAPSYSPFCSAVSHVTFDDAGEPRLAPPPNHLAQPDLDEKFAREILRSDPGVGLDDILWRARADLFDLRFSNRRQPLDPAQAEKALAFTLGEIQRVVAELGAQLLVVHVPSLQTRPASQWRTASSGPPEILRRALPEGATLVDLAPAVGAHLAQNKAPPGPPRQQKNS